MTVATDAALLTGLRPPPGYADAPVFERGWRRDDGAAAPFISYLENSEAMGWSAALEAMHEDSSLDHPIDVLTRQATVAALRGAGLQQAPALLDVGCSSGHLLCDLRAEWPRASLAGIDAEDAGLAGAHARVPDAALMHASATDLPLADGVVDGLVALNLLEHLPDDAAALGEFARVMRPGACAVVVVPSNPKLYDYYDAYLQHERRYARGELAAKAESVGLAPRAGLSLGSVVYPGFWFVKTRNRRRAPGPDEVRAYVEADIARSSGSPVARAAFRLEAELLRRGARPQRGIREVLVLERPA